MRFANVRRVGLLTAMSAGIGVLGVPVTTAHAAQTLTVNIQATQTYAPDGFTINPGDTVDWVNQDPQAIHNAGCADPHDCPEQFSTHLKHGDTGTVTFHYSGTYTYHCSAHASMIGHFTVTGNVQPPANQPAGNAASGNGATPTSTGTNAPSGSTTRGTTTSTPKPVSTSSAAPLTALVQAGASPAGADSLNGSPLNLPKPQVVVQTPPSSATPAWAVVAAAVLLAFAGALFGLAWFGPRPQRGEGKA